MNFCPSCGAALVAGASFCAGCGVAVPQASAAQIPAQPVASSASHIRPPRQSAWIGPDGRAVWQDSLPGPFSRVPVELLAVCTLLVVAGALVLWPAIDILPDLLGGLDDGEFIRDIALLFLSVWIVLTAFGLGCLVLSWRLAHADRVARGLTYVLAGALGASILIGDDHGTQLILTMVACFASIAVLAWSPRVRDYFTGPNARQYDQPTPVVTARTLVVLWSSALVLVGAMFVPLSAIGDKYVVTGALLLVLGIAGFVLNKRLADGDPLARLLISAGAVVYTVLLFVVDRRDPGLILPLSISLGTLYFLWLPDESKAFFAAGAEQRPLPAWMTPPAPPAVAPAAGSPASSVPQPAAVTAAVPAAAARAAAATAGATGMAPSRSCSAPDCAGFAVATSDNFCQHCGRALAPAGA